MSIDHGKVLDAGVERLRQALKMHNEHRTTLQSLASSVGDFLRDYVALAQPAEAVELSDDAKRMLALESDPAFRAQYDDAAQGAVACDVVDPDGSTVALRVDIEYADELLQEYKYSDCRKTNYLYAHPQAAPAQVEGE